MTGTTFMSGKYEGCRPGDISTEGLYCVLVHDRTWDDISIAREELRRRRESIRRQRSFDNAKRDFDPLGAV